MGNLIPVKTSLAALNIYDYDDDDDNRNKPSVHKMMNILSLQNTNPINNKLRFSFVLPTNMNDKLSSRQSLWRTRAQLGWVYIESLSEFNYDASNTKRHFKFEKMEYRPLLFSFSFT